MCSQQFQHQARRLKPRGKNAKLQPEDWVVHSQSHALHIPPRGIKADSEQRSTCYQTSRLQIPEQQGPSLRPWEGHKIILSFIFSQQNGNHPAEECYWH